MNKRKKVMNPCPGGDDIQTGKRSLHLRETKQLESTCENLWKSQWRGNSELKKELRGAALSEEGSRGDQTAAGPTSPVGNHE